jgi:hypothetical protein
MKKALTKKANVCLALMLTVLPVAFGQNRRQAGQVEDPSLPDVAHFTATVVREYDSVAGLFSDSDLVVQADVKSVLPTRDLSTTPRTHNLVTDAVVTVTRTFKGPLLSEVAVVQMGGIQGNRQRIPDQYRLLKQGEHYVLFLKQDPRMQ